MYVLKANEERIKQITTVCCTELIETVKIWWIVGEFHYGYRLFKRFLCFGKITGRF